MFMKKLENELNTCITENGALTYKTSGKSLLDMNFQISSMRNKSEHDIAAKFSEAFIENPELAMRWLFYVRDIRGGVGERRLFRICFEWLTKTKLSIPFIHLVPKFGRWDDLWNIESFNTCVEYRNNVVKFVAMQLSEDVDNMNKKEPVSLCAKWMPSVNSKSNDVRTKAKIFANALGVNQKEYRKTLSQLRAYTDVVERKMSAKSWDTINYETVPSRANLIYNNAFLKNDEERRRDFLSQLSNGEVKINSATLFPHDIVNKYTYNYNIYDDALEGMWRNLPDFVNGCGNTIVVADGSGSMTARPLRNSTVSALDVANALAIYFAERSSGQFADKYITFSSRPQLVDLSNGNSLREKIIIAKRHNEVSNTNIHAVFNLILNTAINNNMSQNDMPNNILILSDMQFDACATCDSSYSAKRPTKKLFEEIEEQYRIAGYKIPRMVFWNIMSPNASVPVIENELGVALVSGFSPSVVKMVMSAKTDPYECLIEALMDSRYDEVSEIFNTIQKTS